MMEQGPVLIITFQAQVVMVIKNQRGEVVEGDPVSDAHRLCTRSLGALQPSQLWGIHLGASRAAGARAYCVHQCAQYCILWVRSPFSSVWAFYSCQTPKCCDPLIENYRTWGECKHLEWTEEYFKFTVRRGAGAVTTGSAFSSTRCRAWPARSLPVVIAYEFRSFGTLWDRTELSIRAPSHSFCLILFFLPSLFLS